MDATKIQLSAKEIKMARDAGIILTKNRIMDKTRIMLGHLQSEYREALVQSDLPPILVQSSPKISRGENYKGLPWMVLDYPRRFSVDNVFAIRSMFWWGNFFSITLHLSGKFKKDAEDKLMTNLKALRKKGFSLCKNDNQWEHHFEKSNYVLLEKIKRKEAEAIIKERDFVKIAFKFPIEKWQKARKILQDRFNFLLSCVESKG